MAGEQQRRRALIRLGGGLVAVALMAGFVWFVQKMTSLKISKPERQVQTIQLIRPPPPPPPDQPPPPPPPKVEQVVQQDKPEPTPEPEQAPPDVLANDGPASPGSDSFGMHQGAGGFIGGNGTAPFAWYTNHMRDEIKEKLANLPCVKSAKGSISTQIVVDASGHVKRIQLTSSTGNTQVDGCLVKALNSITQLDAEPPPGMPEAVNMKIVF